MKEQTLFKKEKHKRYWLHRKIKANGFKVDAFKRTIYVFNDAIINNDIKTLRDKYGYNVQVTIEVEEV